MQNINLNHIVQGMNQHRVILNKTFLIKKCPGIFAFFTPFLNKTDFCERFTVLFKPKMILHKIVLKKLVLELKMGTNSKTGFLGSWPILRVKVDNKNYNYHFIKHDEDNNSNLNFLKSKLKNRSSFYIKTLDRFQDNVRLADFMKKKVRGFSNLMKIEICWRLIFEILIIHNPFLGSCAKFIPIGSAVLTFIGYKLADRQTD